MALLDFLKKRKKREERLRRPPEGALKQRSARDLAKSEEKSKKETEEKGGSKGDLAKERSVAKEGESELASKVILAPHITERTTGLAEKNVYTFRVAPTANKTMVKQAIKELYGFQPDKIRILNMPSKSRSVSGKKGRRPGYRKAYVYLREGEKIELI
jgi:large subunit ribosomal protein L23